VPKNIENSPSGPNIFVAQFKSEYLTKRNGNCFVIEVFICIFKKLMGEKEKEAFDYGVCLD